MGKYLAMVFLAALVCAVAEANPVVGVYFRPSRDMGQVMLGAEGIMIALEEEYDGTAFYMDNFDPEILERIDVLILSCVYGYPGEWGEAQVGKRVREFAESGKGVILINESVGWRRAFSDNPMFPEIGRGTGKGTGYMDTVTSGVGPDRVVDIPLVPVDPRHPVTEGLSGKFEVSSDMPELRAGTDGTVLVAREAGEEPGAAAVVAGSFGSGWVVLIAPHVGLGRRIMEVPPEDDLLKLLLNSIRWTGIGE